MNKIGTLNIRGGTNRRLLLKKDVTGCTPEQITCTLEHITETLISLLPKATQYTKHTITIGPNSIAQRYVILEQPLPQDTITTLSKSFRIT